MPEHPQSHPLPREGPQDTDRVRFTFTPRPEHVALARMLVGTLAHRHGLGDDAVEDVRLLVSEACTNAVRAHRRRRDPRPVSITCTLDGELLIEVSDTGGGLDMVVPGISALPSKEAGGPEDNSSDDSAGYGIPIMQRIADRSSFESNADGGTTVRLVVGVTGRRRSGA